MIRTTDIAKAIEELVRDQVPEVESIHTDLDVAGFIRPALLIESVTTVSESATAATVEITEHFNLTVFEKVDELHNTSTEALLELRQKIMDIFRVGYLRVGDRALNARASPAGWDFGQAYIELQLHFFDDRSDAPDTTPKMENIHTNLTTEKG